MKPPRGKFANPPISAHSAEGCFDTGGAQMRDSAGAGARACASAARRIVSLQTRPVTWVVAEEVKSGDWGIADNPLSTADVKALAAGQPVG